MINFISPERLRTGNDELDKEIGFLLSVVQGDIDRFLNNRGYIKCSRIVKQKNEIISGLDSETQESVKNTLKEVKRKLNIILNLGLKLKRCINYSEILKELDEYGEGLILNIISLNTILSKCSSVSECEDIISKYGNGLTLDIFSLSTILSKCSSVSECEDIISKYGNGLTLNIISLNTILSKCSSVSECEDIISRYGNGLTLDIFSLSTILKIIFKDGKLEEDNRKNLIKNILELLDKIGNLDKSNEGVIARIILSYGEKYNNFIYEVINGLKLKELYFLNEYLEPKKINPIKNNPLESEYEKRLKEALKAGLDGTLAESYASGRLQVSVGGGGKGHNKKGSKFGKKVKKI